ncbi:hypothetical protein H0H81_010169 [Sphagnurus paluster]|uniref:Uncharacterized protein n=1 Tax=Sphagnurus paluster TaxID=117069 RepID=A0A9P7FVC2_9AGAR|nr:hypothetical protein H0H81_010169 [Sphagnurus paluster]
MVSTPNKSAILNGMPSHRKHTSLVSHQDSNDIQKKQLGVFSIFILAVVALILGLEAIDRSWESSGRSQIRQRWGIEIKNHQNEEVHWRSRLDDLYRKGVELVEKQDEMNQDYVRREEQWKIRMDHTEATHSQRLNELNERYQNKEQEYLLQEEQWKIRVNRAESTYSQHLNELNERYRLKKAEYVLQEEQWKIRTDLAETTFKQRFNELNEIYRQRETELQEKIEHFEEDLQKRFEEELRRKFEREKRQPERARVYWSNIQGEDHCIANGRKKYTAQLANLLPTVDAMDACENTPVEINGITYGSPISCEDQGNGVIRGHWIADKELMCAAYWEFTQVKDCTAPKSGLRRVEAKLGAVHDSEDRETLCLTTPLTINGETYERPMACPNWISWEKYGFWGIWDVADESCT